MPTKRLEEELQHLSQSQSSAHVSLRYLLPKKGWEPLKKPPPVRADRNTLPYKLQLGKRCPVPSCNNPKCTLRTHRQYRHKSTSQLARASSASNPSHVRRAQDVRASRFDEPGTKFKCTQSPPTVSRYAFHGLEGLPASIAETPIFCRLFHEFFGRMYDRIFILLSPPPVDPATKQACLALAMTSPAYCLNALACVENEAVMKKKGTGHDPTATVLYGKVMSILRLQVANFETAEIDNLLMIICTLSLYDVVHHNFSNLDVHRQGMVQLVDRVGGVHNLGSSLPIVLNLDRMVALYTGELPKYARLIDRTIQRPIKYPEVALELFEGAKISFDPDIANKTADADIFYFYFSRQRVADHFTFLNHKHWALPSRSRCVLLTTKILDYTILVDNYINVIPAFLASKVKETLDRLKADSWNGYEDVLIWILFVLVTALQPPITNDWALVSLREMLITKYDGVSGSLSWMKQELQNVKRFVWCSSRLDEAFLEVCYELTGSRDDEWVDIDSDTTITG